MKPALQSQERFRMSNSLRFNISFFYSIFLFSINFAIAAEPICGGHPAILAAWSCNGGNADLCYLWGINRGHTGKWEKESRFVIEDSTGNARLVDFSEACQGGRCARAEMAICSTPVARGEGELSQLERLLWR